MADNAAFEQTPTVASEEIRVAAQALLAEVQPYLNFEQGDVIMFAMDMPDVPPQYAPVVIAQAPQGSAQQDSNKIDRTIGICHLIQNPPIPPLTAVNALSPLGSVSDYIMTVEKKYLGLNGTVTVLQGPEHGTLKDVGSGYYRFVPDSDYQGPDRATLLVEMGGLKVKVMYFFKVGRSAWGGTEGYDPYLDKENCPQGPKWKISLNPDDPNAPIYTFEHSYQLTGPYAGLSNVNLTFDTLAPGALGQTVGTTITLDGNTTTHTKGSDSIETPATDVALGSEN